MKTSSNNNMEQVFTYLENIKSAEPSKKLYNLTLARLKSQNIISLYWVRAVACVLIIVISAEIYFVSTNKNNYKETIAKLIPKTNNTLYNE